MMWQKTFIILLTFSVLSKSQDIGDEDYDEDDSNFEEELGMEPEMDFHNELLDNLISSSIVNYPKTVNIHVPSFPISDVPFQMTAKSGVFEDLHSIKRASQVDFHDVSEELAHISVSFKFDTFSVTYDDFAFKLDKFTAKGKLVVRVLENELYISITGGRLGERCFVRANDINFTKLKKFQVEYYSDTTKEESAKCHKNISVFRSFFGRTFINAVKATFAQILSETMNGFVKTIEENVCAGE